MMSIYHMHEGSFAVPEGWRDQSMTVFRLPVAKGKEAAIVITRDYETSIDDPMEYARAQQEAAKKNFPGFKSLGIQEQAVAEKTAAVVDYQWRANGSVLLRQRQAYLKHEQVMLTLTVSTQFDDFDRVEPAWSSVLGSLRLATQPTEEPEAECAPMQTLPHVFVLSTKTRELRIYPNAAAASAQVDAFEVEDAHWLFFDSKGEPLRYQWNVSNKRSLLSRQAGTFELLPDPANVGGNLRTRLRGAILQSGVEPFDDLAAVELHLSGQPVQRAS
jgi:hypothetical protein